MQGGVDNYFNIMEQKIGLNCLFYARLHQVYKQLQQQ